MEAMLYQGGDMLKRLVKAITTKNKSTSRLAAGCALLRSNEYLSRVGWFESWEQGMPCTAAREPLPWLTYEAIAFLQTRIDESMSVFEYGSGNSTIWWSRRLFRVVSCEHDLQWYLRMRPHLAENVEYFHVELGPGGEYAKAIAQDRGRFDIVVIDGRDRVSCARNAVRCLEAHGVIVWDNSDRDRYAAGFAMLAADGFRRLDFVGMGPCTTQGWCTSVFYRPGNCLGI